MKWKIIILLMLVPISIGLECQMETEPKDIPCIVTTTWILEDACNLNNVRITNSSGQIIQELSLQDFGTTGFCNFTFNISSEGNYNYNLTAGDSGQINVQAKETMASTAVMIFLLTITAAVFYIPTKVGSFSDKSYLNSLIRGLVYVFGLLLLSLDVTVAVTIADKFSLGVNQELFRFMWLINWSIYLSMFVVILTFGKHTLDSWQEIAKAKRMGENVK